MLIGSPGLLLAGWESEEVMRGDCIPPDKEGLESKEDWRWERDGRTGGSALKLDWLLGSFAMGLTIPIGFWYGGMLMCTSCKSTTSVLGFTSASSSAFLLTPCMYIKPSSATSFLVVFILSLRLVLRIEWVLVLELLPLRTLGSASRNLCSANSTSLSLISGSSVISKGVSPDLQRYLSTNDLSKKSFVHLHTW